MATGQGPAETAPKSGLARHDLVLQVSEESLRRVLEGLRRLI